MALAKQGSRRITVEGVLYRAARPSVVLDSGRGSGGPFGRTSRRTRRCSRRQGMNRFWDFKLTGAPPLLSLV